MPWLPVRNDSTEQATGCCLEVHDLAVSKLLAGREKDRGFIRALVKHGLVRVNTVRERLGHVPVDPKR